MKKYFNKRNESINKRLMESWGYAKKEGLISENVPSFDNWARSTAPRARGYDHQADENEYQRWRNNPRRKAEYQAFKKAYLDKLEKDKIDKAAEEFFAQDRTPDKDPLYNYRFEEGNTENQ